MNVAFLRGFCTVGLLALSFALSACQNSPITSETQSLDNFAAGKTLRVNSCSGDAELDMRWNTEEDRRIMFGKQIRDKLTESTKQRYIGKVKQYLSSIPAPVQKAYLDLGGVIMMNDNAWERCTGALESKSSDQVVSAARRLIESCLLYVTENPQEFAEKISSEVASADNAGNAVLAIYHQIDPRDVDRPALRPDDAINAVDPTIDANEMRLLHGGVRVFGMAFGQFFSKLSLNNDKGELKNGLRFQMSDYDPSQLSSLKSRLANQFLLDVVKGGDANLAGLETYLGNGAAKRIGDYLLQNGVLKAEFVANPSAAVPLNKVTFASDHDRIRFEDFVFGEAFDSYHCSAATKEVMENEFTHSFQAFGALDNLIVSQARTISLVANDEIENLLERGVDAAFDTGPAVLALNNPVYVNQPVQQSYGCSFGACYGQDGCASCRAACAACRNGNGVACALCSQCAGGLCNNNYSQGAAPALAAAAAPNMAAWGMSLHQAALALNAILNGQGGVGGFQPLRTY